MITKITLNSVTSFKRTTALETNKRVNLIYGLNGTGKSTISNFLADQKHPDYSNCTISGSDASVDILVYNQKFIENNFYTTEEQKGIFTLSKKNVDAEKALSDLISDRIKQEKQIEDIQNKIQNTDSEIEHLSNVIRDQIWEVKQQYSGGDRVLEYCLEGLKRKENLFSYINSLARPSTAPIDTVENLKKEILAISGDTIAAISEVSPIAFSDVSICSNPLWEKIIVGNQSSTLSDVIKRLGNSDWVKTGQRYIDELEDKTQTCPFCQSQTITRNFIHELKSLFDESYETDIRQIMSMQSEYERLLFTTTTIDRLPESDIYSTIHLKLKQQYEEFKLTFEKNKQIIDSKIKSPSTHVEITSIEYKIKEINSTISEINKLIKSHNQKVANKGETLSEIKNRFWTLMRWNYEGQIASYSNSLVQKVRIKNDYEKTMQTTKENLSETLKRIRDEQQKTVNISEAVERIKNGLIDLGIDGFTIENHRDNRYRIVRPSGSHKTFQSLSEGERMIISFLYFIEMCRGLIDINIAPKKKIIVIDDPISSLSHIFIFNISQLIKTHFTSPNSNYEQVFILTHSLYFFYDLTFMKKEDRELHQGLFRLIKNSNGSIIEKMGYTEIQNDYHSYWHIINDASQSPALIANCMRNIIEYFFTFVEKYELSNVLQKPSLQAGKFQAFFRYMNRESHSLGQNIFDIKEFDYDAFKEAFKLVFYETGYEDHYKKMIK